MVPNTGLLAILPLLMLTASLSPQNSLFSAKKALDPSHHSGQGEFVTIAHLFRPFFQPQQQQQNRILGPPQ